MLRRSVLSRPAGALALGLVAEAKIRPTSRGTQIASCSASTATSVAASSPTLTVYQYKICPFCSKVKTYLDYLGLPYTSVEVNPLSKSEISFSKDYKKVPIMSIAFGGATAAAADATLVTDSDKIITFITESLRNKTLSVSASAKAKSLGDAKFYPADTDKWAEWSDKRLAVMLYPNITRSMAESWECFAYVHDVPTWNVANQWVTRSAGAVAMSLANGKIKKKYNIVDERAELKACLEEWTTALGSRNFLHGDYITLPDLMVFGVLRSIAGLSTFKEVMEANGALSAWYARVADNVQSMDQRK